MNTYYDDLKLSIMSKIKNAEKKKDKIKAIYNDNGVTTMDIKAKNENLIVLNDC